MQVNYSIYLKEYYLFTHVFFAPFSYYICDKIREGVGKLHAFIYIFFNRIQLGKLKIKRQMTVYKNIAF